MKSPRYWVVKRDFENHYFRVETGTYVKTRREATHFAGDGAARIVRDMLRAKATHYKIALVAVFGPRERTANDGYRDGWRDAMERAIVVADRAEKDAENEDQETGTCIVYNALIRERVTAEATPTKGVSR